MSSPVLCVAVPRSRTARSCARMPATVCCHPTSRVCMVTFSATRFEEFAHFLCDHYGTIAINQLPDLDHPIGNHLDQQELDRILGVQELNWIQTRDCNVRCGLDLIVPYASPRT